MAGDAEAEDDAWATTPRVDVLGPCALEVGRDAVPLTAAQRRIVARLALDAPRTVSATELVDAVWGGEAPATARTSLTNHIARIRAGAGADVIATTPDGYLLTATTDVALVTAEIDDAERCLARGEVERAFVRVEAALGRWRGDPFADIAEVELARPRQEHLSQLRSHAETLRLDAAVEQRRTGWAVAEAERLLAEHPLDERRWALLVTALDRGGQRGDALAAVDRARRALRDGAGLDLGSRLREVESSILAASSDRPEVQPTRMVGRQHELQTLLAAAGAGDCTIVTGEDGAGKSTLLAEAERRLRRSGGDGPLVAHTRCHANPSTPVAVLGELLDAIGVTSDRGTGPVEGFVAAVEKATAEQPVVLIVDDLHLAGPSSRAALAAAAHLDGVALIATIGAGTTVDDLPDPTHLDLAPLDGSVVAALAIDLLGSADDAASATLDWLVDMSGGNPLILICLLDRADGLEAGPDASTSEALADLVRRRLDGLDGGAVAAVQAAAVCGGDAPTDLVIALASATGINAAATHGLLEVEGGRVRFRHGALQRAVYADVPQGRRIELHYAAASTLRGCGGPEGIIADHLLVAAELDPILALDAARKAAGAATAQGAHHDAARWHRRSQPLARSLGAVGRDDLVRALVGEGNALRLAGNRDHERILFEAADLAVALGDPDLIGDAALAQLELGATTETGQLHERAVGLALHALDVVTDPERRSMIAAATSLAHSMSGHPDRCRALFLEAERDATEDETRRRVLPFTYLALGHPDDLERRDALSHELLGRARAAGDQIACFEGLQLVFSVALQRADGSTARAAVDEMGEMVDRLGDVGRRWAARYTAAAIAHLDDDLVGSEALASEALEIFSPVEPSRAFAAYGGQLLALRHTPGRAGELAEVMAGLVADPPAVPAWHAALALTTVDVDPTMARHHAAAALEGVPHDFLWLAAHMVGARAAASVGDRKTAAEYARRLTPYAGRVCWQGTCAYGPVDTALAALALAEGDRGRAEGHAAGGRRLADRLGAPVFLREVDELMARG